MDYSINCTKTNDKVYGNKINWITVLAHKQKPPDNGFMSKI